MDIITLRRTSANDCQTVRRQAGACSECASLAIMSSIHINAMIGGSEVVVGTSIASYDSIRRRARTAEVRACLLKF